MPLDPTSDDLRALRLRAVFHAVDQIGRGEVGGNNRGPDVLRYFRACWPRLASLDAAPGDRAWCAAFVSWCYVEAARDLGIRLPFRPSLSARTLGRRIVAFGRAVDPREAEPGDVVIWSRRDRMGSFGHAAIVREAFDGTLRTVEGNVGRFPAKVREFEHDVERQATLLGCARPEPREAVS